MLDKRLKYSNSVVSTSNCHTRAPVKHWSMTSHEILTPLKYLLTTSHQPSNELVWVRTRVVV